MKITNSYFSIFLLLLFTSCSNNSNYTRIELTSPTDNELVGHMSLVNIKGKIYEDGKLIRRIYVKVTAVNSSNGTPLLDFKDDNFHTEYDLNQQFVAASGYDYKIEIGAFGGYENWTIKKITVKCN